MKWITFVTVASLLTACSVGAEDAENVGSTHEALTKTRISELFCAECFEETSGGGPGSASGLGTNGFVGGSVGWANGTVSHIAPKGGCASNPDPDVECVEVRGSARPLKDSDIRIVIFGRDKSEVVTVDVPLEKDFPDYIAAPKARVWKCSAPGVTCQAECSRIGAYCDFERLHPQDNNGWSGDFGMLTGCKANTFPNISHTCTYVYKNGDKCTELWPFGMHRFLCDVSGRP